MNRWWKPQGAKKRNSSMYFRFQDRQEAGQVLADKLKDYKGKPETVVLALPRGGVPVGYEVAEKLQLPLDIFVVRKLGVPWNEEFAMGAIASGGSCYLNQDTILSLHIPQDTVNHIIEQERAELERREKVYRENAPPIEVQNKTVILVDDGLATGASMKAAVMAVRQRNPARIIVAVPVAAKEVRDQFMREADEVVCVETPEPFFAVGEWYENFGAISNEEVRTLLEKSRLVESV
jgi:putative phosphoribosyl transferase